MLGSSYYTLHCRHAKNPRRATMGKVKVFPRNASRKNPKARDDGKSLGLHQKCLAEHGLVWLHRLQIVAGACGRGAGVTSSDCRNCGLALHLIKFLRNSSHADRNWDRKLQLIGDPSFASAAHGAPRQFGNALAHFQAKPGRAWAAPPCKLPSTLPSKVPFGGALKKSGLP